MVYCYCIWNIVLMKFMRLVKNINYDSVYGNYEYKWKNGNECYINLYKNIFVVVKVICV